MGLLYLYLYLYLSYLKVTEHDHRSHNVLGLRDQWFLLAVANPDGKFRSSGMIQCTHSVPFSGPQLWISTCYSWINFTTLKMEAAVSHKIFLPIHQTERRHIPEELNISYCNENQLDSLFIFSLLRHSTCTCFGHIYCPSSGSIYCIYTAIGTCYTFRWMAAVSQLKNITRTNCCIYTVNTSWWWAINMSETCRCWLT
jgi:hypothetical protein